MRETYIALIGLLLSIIINVICIGVIFGGDGPKESWFLKSGEEKEKTDRL